MTKPIVYYWPPADNTVTELVDDIATEQDVADGAQFVLTVNTPGVPPVFSYDNAGVHVITPAPAPGIFSYVNILNPSTTTSGTSTDLIRSISFSQTFGDNSDVTYIISGIGTPIDGNGNPTQVIGPIVEQLVGPGNGEIVSSANIYTVINSITATGADAHAAMVGYGPNGITNYNRRDNNRNVPSVYGDTYQLQFINNSLMVANTYVSLNQPEIPNVYGSLDPFGMVNGDPVAFIPYLLIDANINTYILNSPPFGFSTFWTQISDCTSDSLFVTVMQPGI